MIPKVIHYCWFGKNQKNRAIEKCILSWKKYCPDYQIIEWNEENFDVHCNPYVEEAYYAKKWSFVADYARLWIVYHNGGIYLDTDVEIVRNLDGLLANPAYFGFEDQTHINTGVGFGAEKGNPIVKCMLDDYDSVHFLREDGSYDLTTCPYRNTKAIEKYVKGISDTTIINRINDATFFPKEYFCPLDWETKTMKKTKHTFSVHWFDASWMQEEQQVLHEHQVLRQKYEKVFGRTVGNLLLRVVYLIFYPREREVLKKL